MINFYSIRNLAAASGFIGATYRTVPPYPTPISGNNLNHSLATRQQPAQIYYNTKNDSIFHLQNGNRLNETRKHDDNLSPNC